MAKEVLKVMQDGWSSKILPQLWQVLENTATDVDVMRAVKGAPLRSYQRGANQRSGIPLAARTAYLGSEVSATHVIGSQSEMWNPSVGS